MFPHCRPEPGQVIEMVQQAVADDALSALEYRAGYVGLQKFHALAKFRKLRQQICLA
jgi:hypothetical protein